jgi:hypothetical protein
MMSTTKSNMLYCARTKLPSIAPNVQTLFLTSLDEVSVYFCICLTWSTYLLLFLFNSSNYKNCTHEVLIPCSFMLLFLQKVNTPMLAVKFLYLKHLEIVLVEPSLSPDYDFCSLASFLDGSPSLDTLILHVSHLSSQIYLHQIIVVWEFRKNLA